eukprot:1945684-Amphidinium_carterae.1
MFSSAWGGAATALPQRLTLDAAAERNFANASSWDAPRRVIIERQTLQSRNCSEVSAVLSCFISWILEMAVLETSTGKLLLYVVLWAGD